MMIRPPLLLAALAAHAAATSYKFPGYGFSWYAPACTNACWSVLSGATLSCSKMDHSGDMGDDMMSMTSPDCQAGDTALLTSVAYCIEQNCPEEVTPAQREDYWRMRMLDATGTVRAKWTYGEALAQVKEPPTVEFNKSSMDVLNQTVLVDKDAYGMNNRFNLLFDHIEKLQARYTFVIITIGFGSPIFFSTIRFLPFMTDILDKLKPYLVYPSLIGSYHVRPLPWLLGNAPTVGQALWIFIFFVINLVLSCVNYQTMPKGEMPWGYSPREEILAYIGYRTGHFGYTLLPLVILLSGRNNLLLWVTNWSYDTYLVLHRWVARMFALYAIIHSVTLLGTYTGSGKYATDSKEPFWLWGIVATVLTCAMLVFSMLWFRRLAYELFLILHILMAVFVLGGCWYHVILRFGYNFYDNWLFAAMAIWAFDRLVRILRVMKNGIRRATVTDIGADYVRVDIPGVRWVSKPGHVAYVYFPTVNKLRPWENHPFSVNSTSLFQSYRHTIAPIVTSSDGNSSDGGRDLEKSGAGKVAVHGHNHVIETTGLTLVIKKSAGLTRLLKSHSRLLTLVDGPYPQKPCEEVLKCDHLLLIGGGIGITGLIAWIHTHPNIKLAWSVQSNAEPLVRELDTTLASVADKQVYVGERLDIDALLRQAAESGYKKVGIVVCGPPGMCDDVRAKVAGIGRGGSTVFELEVDAFSW